MLSRAEHAWRNPIGLGMLGTSALAAALTASLPLLEPWAGRAPLALLAGLLGYAGTVAICAWPSAEAAEVRQVRRLRDAMAAQLAERRAAEGRSANLPLTAILADALSRLDRDMLPAITRLAAHNQAFRKALDRFTRGELVAPDPEALARLQAIEARQRETIAATRRQVANAYAAMLALSQQSDFDAGVVAETERWSRQLSETEQALAELLDESVDWARRLETGGTRDGSADSRP